MEPSDLTEAVSSPADAFAPSDAASCADVARVADAASRVRAELRKIIVGQEELVELLLATVLTGGHALIEGVPGIAKTLSAKLLARTLDAPFTRIQFTPDLMPSDVLGTSVFDPRTTEFSFHRGPIFSNIVLIDEINRAPAKTQSALFEVMEERQVSVEGTTYPLEPPFHVFATQNPLEHEGTYRLPEAQLDRFLFKIDVGYPSLEEEVRILEGFQSHGGRVDLDLVATVWPAAEVVAAQAEVRRVHVEPRLLRYAAEIVSATRGHRALYLAASPRASLALVGGAKAFAAMRGRDFVTPDDLRDVTAPVLRHRILLTPEREMEGIRPDAVIRRIVEGVEVPR
jgi:MoxR-like ATPase